MGYHVAYDAKMMEAAGFDMSSFTYYDPMYAFAFMAKRDSRCFYQ